jgi:hypothetical protein
LECMAQRFRSVVALTALDLPEMVVPAVRLVKAMWVLKRARPEAATLVALAVHVGPWKERPVLFPAALVETLLMV